MIYEFDKPKQVLTLALKNDQGVLEFEKDQDKESPIPVNRSELIDIIERAPQGTVSQTSMRLDTKNLWTLELIKRSSKALGGENYRTYGSIIDSLLSPFHSSSILQEKTATVDIPLELKRLKRAFYVNESEIKETYVPALTFDEIYIFRLLNLCLIEESLLEDPEKKLISWLLKSRFFNSNKYKEEFGVKENLINSILDFSIILFTLGTDSLVGSDFNYLFYFPPGEKIMRHVEDLEGDLSDEYEAFKEEREKEYYSQYHPDMTDLPENYEPEEDDILQEKMEELIDEQEKQKLEEFDVEASLYATTFDLMKSLSRKQGIFKPSNI